MPKSGSNDSGGADLAQVADKSSSRTSQTKQKEQQSTRWSASATAGTKPSTITASKENNSKQAARFGALPLQQGRVLQQLQTLSLSSTSAAPCAKANSARQIKQFIPKQRPAVSRQPKLRCFKLDPAGNTDSEVDSPVSQPAGHWHHISDTALPRHIITLSAASRSAPEALDACSACNGSPAICKDLSSLPVEFSQASVSASAITPARTGPQALLPESITDTPDSMAMSTPVCGQAPPSTSTSTAALMSCSTTGIQSAERLGKPTATMLGSPMCISPDTWATPQQLQWETSSESLSAAPHSPLSALRAHSPSASQVKAADLQFGLDNIKEAAAAAGSIAAGKCRRSRLASSIRADQVAELPNSDTVSERQTDDSDEQIRMPDSGSQGYDRRGDECLGEAEWLEDVEGTSTASQDASTTSARQSDGHQSELQLSLDIDDEDSEHVALLQVRLLLDT